MFERTLVFTRVNSKCTYYLLMTRIGRAMWRPMVEGTAETCIGHCKILQRYYGREPEEPHR